MRKTVTLTVSEKVLLTLYINTLKAIRAEGKSHSRTQLNNLTCLAHLYFQATELSESELTEKFNDAQAHEQVDTQVHLAAAVEAARSASERLTKLIRLKNYPRDENDRITTFEQARIIAERLPFLLRAHHSNTDRAEIANLKELVNTNPVVKDLLVNPPENIEFVPDPSIFAEQEDAAGASTLAASLATEPAATSNIDLANAPASTLTEHIQTVKDAWAKKKYAAVDTRLQCVLKPLNTDEAKAILSDSESSLTKLLTAAAQRTLTRTEKFYALQYCILLNAEEGYKPSKPLTLPKSFAAESALETFFNRATTYAFRTTESFRAAVNGFIEDFQHTSLEDILQNQRLLVAYATLVADLEEAKDSLQQYGTAPQKTDLKTLQCHKAFFSQNEVKKQLSEALLGAANISDSEKNRLMDLGSELTDDKAKTMLQKNKPFRKFIVPMPSAAGTAPAPQQPEQVPTPPPAAATATEATPPAPPAAAPSQKNSLLNEAAKEFEHWTSRLGKNCQRLLKQNEKVTDRNQLDHFADLKKLVQEYVSLSKADRGNLPENASADDTLEKIKSSIQDLFESTIVQVKDLDKSVKTTYTLNERRHKKNLRLPEIVQYKNSGAQFTNDTALFNAVRYIADRMIFLSQVAESMPEISESSEFTIRTGPRITPSELITNLKAILTGFKSLLLNPRKISWFSIRPKYAAKYRPHEKNLFMSDEAEAQNIVLANFLPQQYLDFANQTPTKILEGVLEVVRNDPDGDGLISSVEKILYLSHLYKQNQESELFTEATLQERQQEVDVSPIDMMRELAKYFTQDSPHSLYLATKGQTLPVGIYELANIDIPADAPSDKDAFPLLIAAVDAIATTGWVEEQPYGAAGTGPSSSQIPLSGPDSELAASNEMVVDPSVIKTLKKVREQLVTYIETGKHPEVKDLNALIDGLASQVQPQPQNPTTTATILNFFAQEPVRRICSDLGIETIQSEIKSDNAIKCLESSEPTLKLGPQELKLLKITIPTEYTFNPVCDKLNELKVLVDAQLRVPETDPTDLQAAACKAVALHTEMFAFYRDRINLATHLAPATENDSPYRSIADTLFRRAEDFLVPNLKLIDAFFTQTIVAGITAIQDLDTKKSPLPKYRIEAIVNVPAAIEYLEKNAPELQVKPPQSKLDPKPATPPVANTVETPAAVEAPHDADGAGTVAGAAAGTEAPADAEATTTPAASPVDTRVEQQAAAATLTVLQAQPPLDILLDCDDTIVSTNNVTADGSPVYISPQLVELVAKLFENNLDREINIFITTHRSLYSLADMTMSVYGWGQRSFEDTRKLLAQLTLTHVKEQFETQLSTRLNKNITIADVSMQTDSLPNEAGDVLGLGSSYALIKPLEEVLLAINALSDCEKPLAGAEEPLFDDFDSIKGHILSALISEDAASSLLSNSFPKTRPLIDWLKNLDPALITDESYFDGCSDLKDFQDKLFKDLCYFNEELQDQCPVKQRYTKCVRISNIEENRLGDEEQRGNKIGQIAQVVSRHTRPAQVVYVDDQPNYIYPIPNTINDCPVVAVHCDKLRREEQQHNFRFKEEMTYNPESRDRTRLDINHGKNVNGSEMADRISLKLSESMQATVKAPKTKPAKKRKGKAAVATILPPLTELLNEAEYLMTSHSTLTDMDKIANYQEIEKLNRQIQSAHFDEGLLITTGDKDERNAQQAEYAEIQTFLALDANKGSSISRPATFGFQKQKQPSGSASPRFFTTSPSPQKSGAPENPPAAPAAASREEGTPASGSAIDSSTPPPPPPPPPSSSI